MLISYTMQISSNTILEIHLVKMHNRIMNFICFLYLAVLHDFYINLPAAGFMGNSTVGSIGGKGCLGNMGWIGCIGCIGCMDCTDKPLFSNKFSPKPTLLLSKIEVFSQLFNLVIIDICDIFGL